MWIKSLATVLMLTTPAAAEPLVVFAAASLKGPLDQLAGPDVTISYAGSGTLARQIQQGAPADVVILANTVWMDVLAEADRIDVATRRTILSNRLVLVSADPAEVELTPAALREKLASGRMAIGRINSVPAGIYGKAALSTLGLWEIAAPHLAEVDNVRAALILAARGEVPLALVYASDAQASDAVHIVAAFPPKAHPVIRYEAAQIAGGEDASAFLAQFDDPSIFVEAGFLPPPVP